ncbi:MAG: ABC-F family ATP-binding cassette domain-containing protein [Bacteroidota bacterium]
MLSLEQVGIEFGGKWLLQNATYQFVKGERLGLIGRNGAGKSTLLRMIHGDLIPSEGAIHRAGKLKVAFFNQDLLSYQTDRPIVEVARDAFAELLQLQKEINELLQQVEAGETDPAIWDDLAAKQDTFETQGGNRMDAAVHTVLDGLGFTKAEQHMPYRTFSGGWRMRVMLAKMLLTEPDILMLDEPTNHLDLPSIQWLESYLKTFPGTCIVVSHDRFFIDRVSEKIMEISLRQLTVYSGNYSYYVAEKALRQEQQLAAYENQQKHIAQQERFINRFRAKATKARQVQSKIKLLDKLEKIEAPEEEAVKLSFRFVMKEPSGKEVLRLKDISKAYGEKKVLESSTTTILRGDKIALIGANGLGKSTLLRIMVGQEPFDGSCETGYKVKPTFFAQHQLEALHLPNTILREISEATAEKTETELRTLLGCFMFSGEEVDKRIQVLSGGEKSRVALVKTLLSEANFLLLDEPTNHLDIQSIQILVEALNAYDGTYVLVSHDRYFLEKVANKIWYIEDRKVKEYPGTYGEYESWQARRAAAAQAEQQKQPENKQAATSAAPVVPPKKKTAPSLSFSEKKALKNRLRSLERKVGDLEAKIEVAETKVATQAEKMLQPEVAADFAKLSEEQNVYDALEKELEKLTENWETTSLELEEVQEKLG